MAKQTVHIDVVSDVTCPFCFLGKRSLDKAIEQSPDVDVQVRWLPFQLAPDMAEEMDRSEYLERKFGSTSRIQAMHQRLASMGQSQDINFYWDGKTANTLLAHQLIAYAGNPEYGGSAAKQDAVMETLFSQVHEHGQSPASLPMLVEAAEQAGFDKEKVEAYLRAGTGADEARKLASAASRQGISGVPHFTVNNKYVLSGAQPVDAFIEMFHSLST
ncbi:DSBA oxidoreductase [Syncephalis fuscata]|nr:DSBA oxidoreductase [Syncephalis fuscata]